MISMGNHNENMRLCQIIQTADHNSAEYIDAREKILLLNRIFIYRCLNERLQPADKCVEADVFQDISLLFLDAIEKIDITQNRFYAFVRPILLRKVSCTAFKYKNCIHVPETYLGKKSPYYNDEKVQIAKNIMSLNEPSKKSEDSVELISLIESEPKTQIQMDDDYLKTTVRSVIARRLKNRNRLVIYKYLQGHVIRRKSKLYPALKYAKSILKNDEEIIRCAQIFGIIKPKHEGIS